MKLCTVLLSLCVLAAAIGTSAAQGQRAPDTIYHHGNLVTLDGASSVAQAFAVRGDRFVAVGGDAAILKLAGKATRIVDLGGATVIPGLADSHDHLWNAGKYLFRGVDMVGVTSLAEMQSRLRAAVVNAKPGETVFTTTGWNIQPAPMRRDLDAISMTTPIVLIASRRGVGVVNGAALSKLGISKTNASFMGATVPVDKDGEPTGAPPPYPRGVQMIDALLPPLTPRLQDAMVMKAMAERNALGITSTRELAVWPTATAGLQRMRREGKLTLRMALGVEFPAQAETDQYLQALPRPDHADPWLFLDSSGEEPWTPATITPQDYITLMHAERRLGWRPAPHVGADALRGVSADDATDNTLTAYETVDRAAPLNGQRWYIEHAPFATPGEMERMARLGVIVSVQDQGYRPPANASMPPDRMAHMNPVRGFLDHKLVVIAGSDYSGPNPVERETNNPMIPFYFYVTRKTEAGAVLTPSEKISREEALRLFTVNAAYAVFQEGVKGQIAPGMLADFVILNQDLMTVPEEKILATRPLATFVGGKRVYLAPGARF